MGIGVLCDVVTAVADVEREEIKVCDMREKMEKVMQNLDTNNNQMLSCTEFEQIMNMPEALRLMQEVDVDPEAIVGFRDMIFFDDGDPIELNFEDFMNVLLDLRESNEASVKDVLNMWKQMKMKMKMNYDRIQELKADMNRLQKEATERLDNVSKAVGAILAECQKV